MSFLTRFMVAFLLPLCMVNVIVLTTPFAAQDSKAVLQQAEDLFVKEKYTTALDLYEKVISLDPTCLRGYRGIVRSYSALGDPQGGVVHMESLYLETPDKAEVCYGLGYSLYSVARYDDARRYFEKALRLNDRLAEAWNNIAVIYHFALRDYDKARHYYNKAISTSKKTANTWVLEIAKKNLANLPTAEELTLATTQLTLEEFINTFLFKVEADDERAISFLVAGHREHCRTALDWLIGEAMRASAAGRRDSEQKTILLARVLEKHYRAGFGDFALQARLAAYAGLDDEKKKKIVEGEDLLNAGMTHQQQGLYARAQTNYKQARACFERISDKARAGTALLYLGDAYRLTSHNRLAREAYSDALTLFITTRQEDQKALALSSLGVTSSLLGQQADALDFFTRSLKIYQKLRDDDSARKVKQNIEIVKAKIGNSQ